MCGTSCPRGAHGERGQALPGADALPSSADSRHTALEGIEAFDTTSDTTSAIDVGQSPIRRAGREK
jgi:hypothetical protein